MKKTIIPAALAAAALAFAFGGGCSDSTEPEAGYGRLQLTLVDAPGDYEAVVVDVVGVSVHRGTEDGTDGGWHDVALDSFRVDLLTLTDGGHVVLADTLLPAGHYTQVRLLLGDSCMVQVDGVEHPLTVPSGMRSGLKLIHPFDLADGALYEATLDFDADRSVHRNGMGDYILRPTVRLCVDRVSGAIEGVVDPASAQAKIWTVDGPDTVVAWADTMDGSFRFGLLPAGTYDLNVEATVGSWRDTTLTGVAVVAGDTTDVGTVALTMP